LLLARVLFRNHNGNRSRNPEGESGTIRRRPGSKPWTANGLQILQLAVLEHKLGLTALVYSVGLCSTECQLLHGLSNSLHCAGVQFSPFS